MRVLFDQGTTVPIARFPPEHTVRTALQEVMSRRHGTVYDRRIAWLPLSVTSQVVRFYPNPPIR